MRDQIAKIISEVRPEISICQSSDTDLFGILDSLDIIFIVDEIEKQLDIEIQADQILPENFSSLNTLVAFVLKNIK